MSDLSAHDMCLVRPIWDRSNNLDKMSPTAANRVILLRNAFDIISHTERLSSGCPLITYAAIDSKVACIDSHLKVVEYIQEVKDGMHFYSMAMGDSKQYKTYCNITNVFSSLYAFTVIPDRKTYISDRTYWGSLEHVIRGKRECMTHLWSVAKSSEPLMNRLRESMYCRADLTSADLLDILNDIIGKTLYDYIRVTCVHLLPLDILELDALDKTHSITPSVEYVKGSLDVACEYGRKDLLEWLLRSPAHFAQRRHILRKCASTSVDILAVHMHER